MKRPVWQQRDDAGQITGHHRMDDDEFRLYRRVTWLGWVAGLAVVGGIVAAVAVS